VQLGRLPSNRIICWRVVFLRKTSRPALSCPCRWKLCLPRSLPTSVAVLMMMASENKTPCQSLALTGCGGDHLINPGRTGAFWRKRKLEIQIRYRQCVGFDEVSARFYRIAHQRIENLIGRDRIFDGHLKHPAYRRIHGGFPELIGVHFAESLVALHAMAARTFGHQPIERLLEGGHRLPAVASLDVGTLFQKAVELLTQHGNGSIVVTAEEIAVEGDVAGQPVG